MIKAIRWLLGLCNHQWEMVRHVTLEYDDRKGIVGTRAYFRCAVCRDMKTKDFL